MLTRDFHKTAEISRDLLVRGSGSISIGDYAVIQERVVVDLGCNGSLIIGNRAKIKTGVILRAHGGRLSIGERTSIGEYAVLAAHGGLSIGALCMIGPFVLINAAEHLTDSPEPYRFQGELAQGIVVGEDVWIGARATLLDGIHVGNRAIVGAHSLVNKDVAAQSKVVGTPARLIDHVSINRGWKWKLT